ncbi:MAG: LptF/LptG family permease, partial [Candidatus Eremiobacteraeota bacterium]|nr:LptF/LptG family permease [Candidatus Eremiobacteraeota bacterium]
MINVRRSQTAGATLRTFRRLPLKILDRYLLTELAGPFTFGLSAFTLIFSATQILNIGKLVSNQHAPLLAAIEVFLWSIPGIVVLVIPMALLLGVLLAMQRLSGESEITAMKAGGITLVRIVTPLLIGGFIMSLLVLVLQEEVVPAAEDQRTYLINEVINHSSAFNRDLTVSAPLPGGGRQLTVATSFEPHSRTLQHVTLVQYDGRNQAQQIIFADRARFDADRWTLENASTYHFESGGQIFSEPRVAQMQVEIGEKPTELVKRVSHNNPEEMSRTQIAEIVRSGQLSLQEQRKYTATFHEKLARPFACFVFTLIAVPFGLRAVRG